MEVIKASPVLASSYIKQITMKKPLTSEEEKEFFHDIQMGDEKARRQFIELNLRIVLPIAKRYLQNGLSLMDLIEEGNLGLIKAVGKFDLTRECRFATYANWWIRESIEHAVLLNSSLIHVPVYVLKDIKRFFKLNRKLTIEHNRNPSTKEIAELMGKDEESLLKIRNINTYSLSLDAKNGFDDSSLSLLEILPNEDNTHDPEINCVNEILNEHVNKWILNLTNIQFQVIIRRFGLYNFEPMTLEEVTQDIGYTKERIRQIQNDALACLRKIMDAQGIEQNLI